MTFSWGAPAGLVGVPPSLVAAQLADERAGRRNRKRRLREEGLAAVVAAVKQRIPEFLKARAMSHPKKLPPIRADQHPLCKLDVAADQFKTATAGRDAAAARVEKLRSAITRSDQATADLGRAFASDVDGLELFIDGQPGGKFQTKIAETQAYRISGDAARIALPGAESALQDAEEKVSALRDTCNRLTAEILVDQHGAPLAARYRDTLDDLARQAANIAGFTRTVLGLDRSVAIGADAFEIVVPSFNLPGLRSQDSSWCDRFTRKIDGRAVLEFEESWRGQAARLGDAS